MTNKTGLELDKEEIEKLMSNEDEWMIIRAELMAYYLNQRVNHTPPNSPSFSVIAQLNSEKLDEDKEFFSGGSFLGCYFTSEQRKSCKVTMEENRWYIEGKSLEDQRKSYMYVISQAGSLYLGQSSKVQAIVHSQIKAGKPVRTAGHVQHEIDVNGNMCVVFNNDSGHYRPTLKQFLHGLEAAHKNGLLPEDNCFFKFNPETARDDIEDEDNFWSDASEHFKEKKAEPIKISFQADNTAICEYNGKTTIVNLSEEENSLVVGILGIS